MRIGLDLDNTLIDYDALFLKLAVEGNLVPPTMSGNKITVRDLVRTKHSDEAWQYLQSQAYGTRILEAKLFPGVHKALQTARLNGHSLHIVSHKTRHTALLGAHGPDLHEAARQFLADNKLETLVDSLEFANTRQEKCAIVGQHNLDCFVDDLPEVFAHPSFPAKCRQILFGESLTCDSLLHWDAFPLLLDIDTPEGLPLGGGHNSRILRANELVIKRYYPDKRGRCRTEWHALLWLKKHNFTCAPIPLAYVPSMHYSIIRFVEGTPPGANTMAVNAMASFAERLYACRHNATELPPAADACFSHAAIEQQLYQRLKRLESSPSDNDVKQAMHAFLRDKLYPATRKALAACPDTGELPWENRMPSPSDFGLHNALHTTDERIIFLDFEYFGIDDPVKLMSDVLLHPGMNLTTTQRKKIVSKMLKICKTNGDKNVQARLSAWLPLWCIKWCCIILNEFVPDENARRIFSDGEPQDRTSLLRCQLDKATQTFQICNGN